MPGAEVAPDLIDQVTLVMVDVPAYLADQMEMVIGMAQLPACPFVGTQARLPDQVQVGEQGESAVDRRRIDARIGLVHLPYDLLHCQMAPTSIEYLPDPEPGLGEAITSIPEEFGKFSLYCHSEILLVANDSQQGL
jgi:hypothetical protein